MFVSVVLPVYNRETVVGDAIRSVLDQTHEQFELIIVDGGSTDETRAVVDSFGDDRIKMIVRAEPKGVSAARNAGISESSGEIVAFIDSDDEWRPTMLQRQVRAFEQDSDFSVVYTGLTKDYGEPITRDGASGDIYEDVRRMTVPTYTSTFGVRRELLEICGGFDEELPCFEDWDLCLRLARDHAIQYVDEPLVVKGTGGENISAEPDRIADAVRRLTAKHDLPSETRARLWNDVGVTHCEAGQLRKGRPYLRRTLRIDPVQPNAAAAFLLSCIGSPTVFDTAMERVYASERLLHRAASRVAR